MAVVSLHEMQAVMENVTIPLSASGKLQIPLAISFGLSPSGGHFFLLAQKEMDRKTAHRGGAEFLAPARKAALPYVPLPARTADDARRVEVPNGCTIECAL